MVEKVKLPIVGGLETKGLGRREVLQGLMGSAGAAFAIPVLADGHPIQQHLKDHAKVAAADAKANVPEAKPEFLDAHQLETLVSLAERILPRSTEAKVAPFIDQLLAVDTRDNQRDFLDCPRDLREGVHRALRACLEGAHRRTAGGAAHRGFDGEALPDLDAARVRRSRRRCRRDPRRSATGSIA